MTVTDSAQVQPPATRSLGSAAAKTVLAWLAFSSLVALLGLRFFAAFATTPIQTPWDDAFFRMSAREHARDESAVTAARHLLLPWKPPVFQGRLNGYDAWLTAGLKVARALHCRDRELTFQLVNCLLLILQAIVILLFARWATSDWATAAASSFLYTSVPIVFGPSRWVHTENLVLLAGPTWSFLAAWLLDTPGGAAAVARSRRFWRAGLVAYAMALLLPAREYVTPSYTAIFTGMLVGLVALRRWQEGVVAALVTIVFVVPWAPSFVEALKETLGKGGQDAYFHSMSEWIPHVALYTVGPAFSLALALLLGRVVLDGWRKTIARVCAPGASAAKLLQEELSGLHALSWAHWAAMAFYVAGILWTRNRVTRPAILPMVTAIGIVLIWLRADAPRRRWLTLAWTRWTAAGLIVLSWCVLLWQLLVAFDGGRTYAHAGFRLEYFNYPLHLRKLNGPDDNYICIDPCPYDQPK
jgi:hypothetical protein